MDYSAIKRGARTGLDILNSRLREALHCRTQRAVRLSHFVGVLPDNP
jgi:hypothetical protein